jgi:uncharacterized protein YpuA (DUF1002 family)
MQYLFSYFVQIEEKFRLEMTDEEVRKFFTTQIEKSATAVFSQVSDQLHDWAQSWRNFWQK